MCGHVGERRVNIWVVDLKDEETTAHFSVGGYKLVHSIPVDQHSITVLRISLA